MKNRPLAFLFTLFILIVAELPAQSPVQTVWERAFWPLRTHIAPNHPNGTPKPLNYNQAASSDEWWYAHANVYDSNSNQTGHIGAGYYSWVNEFEDETPHNGLSKETASSNNEDFESAIYDKGSLKSSLMLFDNDGNDGAWCRSYYNNEFFNVHQTKSKDGFIAVGRTSSTIHPRSSFNVYSATTPFAPNSPVYYNPYPGVANNTNHFAKKAYYDSNGMGDQLYRVKPLVIKVDNNGNLVWAYIYGGEDYGIDGSLRLGNKGILEHVEEDDHGNIWVTGYYNNTSANVVRERAFILILNSNGEILQNFYLDETTTNFLPFQGGNDQRSTGSCLAFSLDQSEVYIGGTFVHGKQVDEKGRIFLGKFKTSELLNFENIKAAGGTINTIWKKETGDIITNTFDGFSTTENGRLTKFIVDSKGDLVVPMLIGVADGKGQTVYTINRNGRGRLIVAKLDNAGNLMALSEAAEEVMAYDLFTDVKEDKDEDGKLSYVVVSTKKNGTGIGHPYSDYLLNFNDISPYLDNTHEDTQMPPMTAYTFYQNNISATWFWDSDPYVIKFDAQLNTQWEHTFCYPCRNFREQFPGNTKRQECVYSISVNDDHSYTIAGNTSDNFDDTYMMRFKEVDVACLGNLDFVQEIEYGGSSFSPNNINDDVTISGKTYLLDQPIKVTNKATLTIENSTIHFLDSKLSSTWGFIGIQIEPGCKVVLKDAVLTGLDSDLFDCAVVTKKWDGISVEGNSQLSQTDVNQGYLYMVNSTIENAREGTGTTGLNVVGKSVSTNWAKTGGGIIEAYSSKFINNIRSVAMMKYHNPTGSSDRTKFVDCLFEKDADYIKLYAHRGKAQVTMWATVGVGFRGCRFINSDYLNMSRAERSGGIYTIDATIHVSWDPTTQARGLFDGYTEAINSENSNYINPSRIVFQDFRNNRQGITLLNTKEAYIGKNTFDLKAEEGQKGVVLKRAVEFSIFENDFNSTNEVVSFGSNPYVYSEPDYGIVIDGNGAKSILENWTDQETTGLIHLNKFKQLGSATYFTRSTEESKVKLTCNEFGSTNNVIDHNFFSIQVSPTGFIDPDQVLLQGGPVCNTFSHYFPSFNPVFPTEIDNRRINNNALHINYVHYSDPDHEPDNDLISPVPYVKKQIGQQECDCLPTPNEEVLTRRGPKEEKPGNWKNLKLMVDEEYTEEQMIELNVSQKKFSDALAIASSIEGPQEDYVQWINFAASMEYHHWIEPTAAQQATLTNWKNGSSDYLAQKAVTIEKIKDMSKLVDDYYPQDAPPITFVEEEVSPFWSQTHWVVLSQNPIFEDFSFWVEESELDLPYRITDASGRLLKDGIMNGNERVETQNWPGGIYFLQVTHPNLGIDILKIVKQ